MKWQIKIQGFIGLISKPLYVMNFSERTHLCWVRVAWITLVPPSMYLRRVAI